MEMGRPQTRWGWASLQVPTVVGHVMTPPTVALPAEWPEELPFAITACSKDFTILYVNARAAETFAQEGGKGLIGKNMLECHTPESQQKLKEILASGKPNVYTITKKGQRKLIYQTPWKSDGKVQGLVEFSLVLPEGMPHFDRDAPAEPSKRK